MRLGAASRRMRRALPYSYDLGRIVVRFINLGNFVYCIGHGNQIINPRQGIRECGFSNEHANILTVSRTNICLIHSDVNDVEWILRVGAEEYGLQLYVLP